MSARFNFAIAEAQEKIQDEAFMDKMGIGDYMTVLASGLKEGLQEKERQGNLPCQCALALGRVLGVHYKQLPDH